MCGRGLRVGPLAVLPTHLQSVLPHGVPKPGARDMRALWAMREGMTHRGGAANAARLGRPRRVPGQAYPGQEGIRAGAA
jgi:hypothetical protein